MKMPVTRTTLPARLALLLGAALLLPAAGHAANDYSAAEKALFMTNHLAALKPPQTLRYSYRKSGSMEAAFDDQVTLKLTPQPNGSCCAAAVDYFSGDRKVRQPEVDTVEGNPVILYFLERDIKEMERLTKGKANYFRKRIRMAVYEGAKVQDTKLDYRGKPIAVREILISPYLDDPNRPRYEKLANKQYRFLMSDAVPGGVYGIRTQISDATPDAAPLIAEELLIDGAARPSSPPTNR